MFDLYTSLNQGDASLREPHITSIFYTLIKGTSPEQSELAFWNFFCKRFNLPYFENNNSKFEIKIEDILKDEGNRRDTDITIFIDKVIFNIEIKINNSSFKTGQIEEQNNLLSKIYPGYTIYNILVLPYPNNKISIPLNNTKILYWYSENNSVIETILEYIKIPTKTNFSGWDSFWESFSNNLEQSYLSENTLVSGKKNTYSRSMYEYLKDISENWHSHFIVNQKVFVKDLLRVFETSVVQDLVSTQTEEINSKINKFKNGALEAQPKIMTINEKNRIHFGISNSAEKQLFYYPEFPDGLYTSKWKDTEIKPLRLMTESNDYVIYYKPKDSNEINTAIYKK